MLRQISPSSEASRGNNFDFLRFLLAVLVLFSHSYSLSCGGDGSEPIMSLTAKQITGGSLAVDAFFAISGYLIAVSWFRSRSLGDFLWRRGLRIYPGYVASAVVCLVMVWPFGTPDPSTYWSRMNGGGFVRSVVLLGTPRVPPTFEGNPFSGVINGSLWTIRYEFLSYIGLAGLGLAGLLEKRFVVLALFTTAYILMLEEDFVHGAYRFASRGETYGVMLPYIGNAYEWSRFATYFLAGTVAHAFSDRIPVSRKLVLVSLGVLVVTSRIDPLFVAALPICGTYALFSLAFTPGLGLEGFARRGDLSYGVYLYAFPLQQLLIYMYNPKLSPLGLFAGALPATLALAWLSCHLVEEPFLRLKGCFRERGSGPRDHTAQAYRSDV